MQRVWTNPSLQRSVITPKYIQSHLSEILRIKMTDTDFSTKEVIVFPDMEYNIVFHDATYGTIKSIKGLVTNVYDDQIKVKYIKNQDPICTKCHSNDKKKKSNKNQPPMPTCNCVLNPADISKYNGPEIFFIPVANILNIEYIVSKDEKEKNKNKDNGVKVMLLGISATFVKSIIVRLEFFDDAIENAVKYVDLQKDGIYDIAYESKDGTVYESRAKVVSIEEVRDDHCKQKNTIVHENVGFDNSVYFDCSCSYHTHTKEDFMKEPPVKRVKIVVDTSESFTGRFEYIMLDSIRDCTLVQDPNCNCIDQAKIDYVCRNCKDKSDSCDPATCEIFNKDNGCGNCANPHKFEYYYDGKFKATVDGENVSLYGNGKETKLDIDTLIKYYLGIG